MLFAVFAYPVKQDDADGAAAVAEYDGALHDGSGSDSWSDADAPPPLWSESLPSDPPAHASSSHLLVPDPLELLTDLLIHKPQNSFGPSSCPLGKVRYPPEPLSN